jgi:hypothetical protein
MILLRYTLAAGSLLAISAFAFPGKNDKTSKTITGCLTKSAVPGQYMITQEATGQKILVRGSADLEKHSANHKVKVTGENVESAGQSVFEASSVEHISNTCEIASK